MEKDNCELLFEYLRSILYDQQIHALDVKELDEPYQKLGKGLAFLQQAVEEMLLMRRLYGTAIVLVTHNIGVVSAMADQRCLVDDGRRMQEYGPAGQVLENPRAEYTRQLLAAVPRIRRE